MAMQHGILGKEGKLKFSVLTHAKVEAVQADPALEYEGAPEYQDPPLYD